MLVLNGLGKHMTYLFPRRLHMAICVIHGEFIWHDEDSLSVGEPHNWPDAVVFDRRILCGKISMDCRFVLSHFRNFGVVG